MPGHGLPPVLAVYGHVLPPVLAVPGHGLPPVLAVPGHVLQPRHAVLWLMPGHGVPGHASSTYMEEKKLVRVVLVKIVKALSMWKRFLARQLLLCLRLSICVLAHAVTCSSLSKCLNDTSRAMKLKASRMLSSVDIVSSCASLSVCCQPNSEHF